MQLNLVCHIFVTFVTAAELKLYDNACHICEAFVHRASTAVLTWFRSRAFCNNLITHPTAIALIRHAGAEDRTSDHDEEASTAKCACI